jgi:hypothetical protein
MQQGQIVQVMHPHHKFEPHTFLNAEAMGLNVIASKSPEIASVLTIC